MSTGGTKFLLLCGVMACGATAFAGSDEKHDYERKIRSTLPVAHTYEISSSQSLDDAMVGLANHFQIDVMQNAASRLDLDDIPMIALAGRLKQYLPTENPALAENLEAFTKTFLERIDPKLKNEEAIDLAKNFARAFLLPKDALRHEIQEMLDNKVADKSRLVPDLLVWKYYVARVSALAQETGNRPETLLINLDQMLRAKREATPTTLAHFIEDASGLLDPKQWAKNESIDLGFGEFLVRDDARIKQRVLLEVVRHIRENPGQEVPPVGFAKSLPMNEDDRTAAKFLKDTVVIFNRDRAKLLNVLFRMVEVTLEGNPPQLVYKRRPMSQQQFNALAAELQSFGKHLLSLIDSVEYQGPLKPKANDAANQWDIDGVDVKQVFHAAMHDDALGGVHLTAASPIELAIQGAHIAAGTGGAVVPLLPQVNAQRPATELDGTPSSKGSEPAKPSPPSAPVVAPAAPLAPAADPQSPVRATRAATAPGPRSSSSLPSTDRVVTNPDLLSSTFLASMPTDPRNFGSWLGGGNDTNVVPPDLSAPATGVGTGVADTRTAPPPRDVRDQTAAQQPPPPQPAPPKTDAAPPKREDESRPVASNNPPTQHAPPVEPPSAAPDLHTDATKSEGHGGEPLVRPAAPKAAEFKSESPSGESAPRAMPFERERAANEPQPILPANPALNALPGLRAAGGPSSPLTAAPGPSGLAPVSASFAGGGMLNPPASLSSLSGSFFSSPFSRGPASTGGGEELRSRLEKPAELADGPGNNVIRPGASAEFVERRPRATAPDGKTLAESGGTTTEPDKLDPSISVSTQTKRSSREGFRQLTKRVTRRNAKGKLLSYVDTVEVSKREGKQTIVTKTETTHDLRDNKIVVKKVVTTSDFTGVVSVVTTVDQMAKENCPTERTETAQVTGRPSTETVTTFAACLPTKTSKQPTKTSRSAMREPDTAAVVFAKQTAIEPPKAPVPLAN